MGGGDDMYRKTNEEVITRVLKRDAGTQSIMCSGCGEDSACNVEG